MKSNPILVTGFVFVVAFIMTACDSSSNGSSSTSNNSNGNSPALSTTSGGDLDLAEEIVNLFFERMKTGEYVGTFEYMSDEYWLYTDKSTMLEIYRVIERDLGFLKETSRVSREYKQGPGNRGGMAYYFEYQNKYDRYNAIETFILVENEFGQYRIFAYDIQSEGFVQADGHQEQEIIVEPKELK